uniref:Pre-mRNA-splicing factor SLU7 n=2 Tax=Rhizochromulina marina TaxID=1034831 RepID=A0A7S2SN22_9STRA|mmetsp:Transcript_32886/g.95161  ORF Transcript_32886/g.95161 Transcript_32886/m.95161 type:complete len:677 (+) Transcript_32886:50-2080(+)
MSSLPQHKTQSYEDRKAARAQAEARQAGTAAPEVDVESGRLINPHNPEFITKRPWYLGDSGPSLNHHAVQKEKQFLNMHEADKVANQRKKRASKHASLEVGMWVEALYRGKSPWLTAKVTKLNLDGTSDIQFEDGRVQKKVTREHIKTNMAFGSMFGMEQEGKLTFDAKRDRWHGYDPTAHKLTIDRFNRMDDERRKRRQAAKDEKYRRKTAAKEAKAKAVDEKNQKKAEARKARLTSAGMGQGDAASDSPHTSDSGTESDAAVGGGRRRAAARSDDSDSDSDYDSDSDVEDDEEADDREFIQRDADAVDFQKRIARQGGVGGAQMKTTVRNLRIREDTAKYLRNLDPNSAYYDPKTRSMRDNPLPAENPEDIPFAGDNYQRISGDAVELARTTVFAWEASERSAVSGIDEVNPVSNPSQVEFARRQFELKKAKLEEDRKKSVLDKYGTGGAEHVDEGHEIRRLALGSTENYVEYGRDGRVVRGAAKAVAKSKYPEDILVNNHTQVWGSWFDRRAFRWGYGDDHSLIRNSYSSGEAGRAANEAAAAGLTTGTERERPMLEARPAEERAAAADQAAAASSRSELFGEQLAPDLDQEKLKKALKKAKKFQKDTERHEEEADDKKRKYNSMDTYEVTKEEMEAYRLTKGNTADPMFNVAEGELLDYEPEATDAKRNKKG